MGLTVKKASQLCTCVVFLIGIYISFYFGLISNHNTNLQIENRRLNALPEKPNSLSDLSAWPEQFEAYYQDHFGLRYTYLKQFAQLKYQLGDLHFKNAVQGTEAGWLFYNNIKNGDPVGDFRNINQYTEQSLRLTVDDILQKHRWFQQRGITYVFLIAPSKHTIYPEYLPEYLQPLAQMNVHDQLSLALSKHPELLYIDLRNELNEAKANKSLLYFKADTHWNYRGANVAQFSLAQVLEKHFPQQITPHFWQDEEFYPATIHYGDLGQYAGLKEEFSETVEKPMLPSCAETTFPEKKKYNDTFKTNCPHQSLKALIFRDSFFTNLQPFVSTYFKQASYIWKKIKFSSLDKQIRKYQPDIVIEQWTERVLPRRYKP